MSNKRMNVPILNTDAIIIDGKVYILVDDDMPDECSRCQLADYCNSGILLCRVVCEDNISKRFHLVGDLVELKVKI